MEISIGDPVFLPSTSAQILSGVFPPELDVGNGKPAWIPAILKEVVGENGIYILDWGHSEVKFPSIQALPRCPSDESFSLVELSKLNCINEASISYALWSRFRIGQFTSRISSLLIFVNPVSEAKRKNQNYSSQMNLMRSLMNADNSALSQTSNIIATTLVLRNRLLSNPAKVQSLCFVGCSGSGKTELLKSSLQMLVYESSVSRNSIHSHPPTDDYESLGSLKNPFILPDDSRSARAMYAGMMVLDILGSAPTAGNRTSSRVLKFVKVIYSNQGRNLKGAVTSFIPLELARCSPKDNFQRAYNIFPLLITGLSEEALNLYKISPALREGCLKAEPDHSYLAAQYENLRVILTSLGLPPDVWDGIVKCLLVCAILQSTQIIGADVANLQTASKNNLGNIEEILGISPPGAFADCVLKVFPEQKIGKPVPTPAKAADAKGALEAISNEIYQRILRYLVGFCNKMSFVSDMREDVAILPEDSCLQLFDPPGWECLEGTANGVVQLNINFIEERVSNWFSQTLVSTYSLPFEQEAVTLPPIELPDPTPYLNFCDDPTTGAIAIMQEICLNATTNSKGGEDKSFADKLLSTHSKSKLIRLASTKAGAKTTQFIVKHSFLDAGYECDGFFVSNKSKLSQPVLSLIDGLPFECLSSQAGGRDPFPIRTLGSTDSSESATELDSSEKKTKSFGVDKNKIASGYFFNRSRDAVYKLLNSFETTEITHVVCLRPSADLHSQTLNPDYLAPQLKQYNLAPFANLVSSSFSYSKKFTEFYEYFRPLLPFHEPTFPLNHRTIPETDFPILSRQMLSSCLKILCIPSTIDDLISTGKVTFGKSRIFMRDEIAALLIEGRITKMKRIHLAATLLQATFRMYQKKKTYKRKRISIFRIVYRVKCFIARTKYRRMRAASNIIKGKLLTKRERERFLKMKSAALLIQKSFLGVMIQRIRYKRMIRALLMFQFLCRGFTMQKEGSYVYDCVVKIQRCAKRFCQALSKIRHERASVTLIQKAFRGWIYREKHMSLIRVFTVRRKQRIANHVARQLQSLYRMRRVYERYRHLSWATKTIQSWVRGRVQRLNFLKIKFLALWLQKNARMIRDVNVTNKMKIIAMVEQEEAVIAELNKQELDRVKDKNSSELIISSGFIKHNLIRFTRRILSLDVTFDLSDAYPHGWLQTIIAFGEQMKQSRRRITMVEVGCEHTILVDDVSNVYTFGSGDVGQLGHNNRKNQAQPRLMETLQQAVSSEGTGFGRSATIKDSLKVMSVSCGRQHSLLLLATGRIYSWGSNLRGQLGHSNFESSAFPRLVGINTSSDILKNVTQISCGSYHSACIVDPGHLYVWGAGDCIGNHVSKKVMNTAPRTKQQLQQHQRQLQQQFVQRLEISKTRGRQPIQLNTPESTSTPIYTPEDCCEPSTLLFFHKKRVHSLICGDTHIAVRSGTSYYSWGKNSQGQVGAGSNEPIFLEPQRILLPEMTETEASSSVLHCGGRHMALLLNGDLWSWGNNKFGQVGAGHLRDVNSPIKILSAGGGMDVPENGKRNPTGRAEQVKGSVCSAALGSRSTLVMTDNGQFFAWGVLAFCRQDTYLYGLGGNRKSTAGRNRASLEKMGEGIASPMVLTNSARRKSVFGVGLKSALDGTGDTNHSDNQRASTKGPNDFDQIRALEQSFRKVGSTFQLAVTPSIVRLPLDTYAPVNNILSLGKSSSSLSLLAIDSEDLDGSKTLASKLTSTITTTTTTPQFAGPKSQPMPPSPLLARTSSSSSPSNEHKQSSLRPTPLTPTSSRSTSSSTPEGKPATLLSSFGTSTTTLNNTMKVTTSTHSSSSWNKSSWKSTSNLPPPDEVKSIIKQTLGSGISISSLRKKQNQNNNNNNKGMDGSLSLTSSSSFSSSLHSLSLKTPLSPSSTSTMASLFNSSSSTSHILALSQERKALQDSQNQKQTQMKQDRLVREGTLKNDSIIRFLSPDLADQLKSEEVEMNSVLHTSQFQQLLQQRDSSLTSSPEQPISSSLIPSSYLVDPIHSPSTLKNKDKRHELLGVDLSSLSLDHDHSQKHSPKKGVAMPRSERSILSKFTSEWKQSQVNHLHQLVGRPSEGVETQSSSNSIKSEPPSISHNGEMTPNSSHSKSESKSQSKTSIKSTQPLNTFHPPHQQLRKSNSRSETVVETEESSSSFQNSQFQPQSGPQSQSPDFHSAIDSLKRDIQRMERHDTRSLSGLSSSRSIRGVSGSKLTPAASFSRFGSSLSPLSTPIQDGSNSNSEPNDNNNGTGGSNMRDMTLMIQNLRKESLQQLATLR